MPRWLGGVDSGSPTLLYVMSMSLLSFFRLPAINVMSCFDLSAAQAVVVQKIQLLFSYLGFAFGMYVLGRILLQRHLAAIFLFIATLFAGFAMSSVITDQSISDVFYLPWAAACGALFHRNRHSPRGLLYLSGTILCLCIEAQDQHPHNPVAVGLFGGILYLGLFPDTFKVVFRKRNLPFVLPMFFILAIAAVQLGIAKTTIDEYVPALRMHGQLKITASDLGSGETNFMHPSALVGSFFPMGFFAGFDLFGDALRDFLRHDFYLRNTGMWLYKLDEPPFVFGWIVFVFAMIFAFRPGMKRARIFWCGFTALFFLASLKISGFYFFMFHLPFFDLFRTYSMFIVFAVFGFLVMGGYGADAYLTMTPEQRSKAIKRTLKLALALTGVAAVFLLLLFPIIFSKSKLIASLKPWELGLAFIVDAIVIVAGVKLFLKGAKSGGALEKNLMALMAVLVASQSVYLVNFYGLGTTPEALFERYNLKAQDLTPLSGRLASDPSLVRRVICGTFGQCYISRRDTMSRFEGTFLRHKEEPLYRSFPKDWFGWGVEGTPYKNVLSEAAFEAITSISHPIFWLSREIATYEDKEELTFRLNQSGKNVSSYLGEVTHVKKGDEPRLTLGSGDADPMTHPKQTGSLTRLERGADWMRLNYQASGPLYLNASVNFDPGWKAKVNGKQTQVYEGNFHGLLVPLPPGDGVVELNYLSWKSEFFFYSRYLFLIAAIVMMIAVCKSIRRGKIAVQA
ncbi:MAG: hypothetical protein AB1540_03090 [Bdellovibrionota bacterium]